MSRVRLKALRTTPEGGVAPISVENESLVPDKADTAAAPLPRMPTESDSSDFVSFTDDEDQDATIAQVSGDLLKEVKRQQFEEGILGTSQIPDYADSSDNSDKTVVGFALTDELASRSFDEPVISTSATNLHVEEEESSNDEKTMFGVVQFRSGDRRTSQTTAHQTARAKRASSYRAPDSIKHASWQRLQHLR